jgi:hypothetical protein
VRDIWVAMCGKRGLGRWRGVGFGSARFSRLRGEQNKNYARVVFCCARTTRLPNLKSLVSDAAEFGH